MQRFLGLLVLVVVGGCRAPDTSIADFVASAGVTFASCGTTQGGHGTCEGCEAAVQCVNNALASCTPVRLEHSFPTIEGAPIRVSAFVHPVDGGCELVVFHDSTDDCGGTGRCDWFGDGGEVTRQSGARLELDGSSMRATNDPP